MVEEERSFRLAHLMKRHGFHTLMATGSPVLLSRPFFTTAKPAMREQAGSKRRAPRVRGCSMVAG